MEELHQRPNATRSYSHSQAKDLFEKAGFQKNQLFSEFTGVPVKRRGDFKNGQQIKSPDI